MIRTNRIVSGLLASLALVATAEAQSPRHAPPWWGVQDEVTVSLYWDFAGGSLTPTTVVAPPWYNPAVTQGTIGGAVTPIANLNGHVDVLGIVGNGQPRQGFLSMTVDNDPHYLWVKVFYFQFDVFEGGSGSVVESIKQDLQKYDRSGVKWSSTPIGNGWETVTVEAQLFPQPDDEEIDWSFTENAFGSVAIDNLFVNSKCVKVGGSDLGGDAMGDTEFGPFDLGALTGAQACVAAAVTEGAAPTFARTLWVSTRATTTGLPHTLVRVQGGQVVGTTPLGANAATAPAGAVDLTVETIDGPLGHVQYVYALVDERSSAIGGVSILAFDALGVPNSTRTVFLQPGSLPPNAVLTGLAFLPSGRQGLGTFVVGDANGNAYEFDRSGARIGGFSGLPQQSRGLGYDPIFGKYYVWSDLPEPTARGPLQVNGYEYSAYDQAPTGTRFWGNLNLPGSPLGGVAGGLEAFRSVANGRLRLGCVAFVGGTSYYYELAAPFAFGRSIAGVTGMQGQPFAAASGFTVTLQAGRSATFASLYCGFSNTFNPSPAATLPYSLSPLGLVENQVLVELLLRSPLLTPTTPGSGSFSFALPPLPAAFRGLPLFCQWLVFDPRLPNGIGLSRGGKTLIY